MGQPKRTAYSVGLILMVLLSLCWPVCDCMPTSMWCPRPCSCYNEWSTVDCSGQHLTSLPPLPNTTTHLYLEHNRLEYLREGAFVVQASTLSTINLSHNQLTIIDTSVFKGLYGLQDLCISSNQLIMFKVVLGANSSLISLRHLDISGNQLQDIPKGLSHFAPNLQVLNLSYNLITSAWLDSSYGAMTLLRQLDFSNNHLHQIGSFHFDSIKHGSLEILKLSDCSLEFINKYSFTGLGNLTSLSLARNPISAAAVTSALDGFGNGSTLAYLDISGLQLGELTYSMVGHLLGLEVLDVSNSSLTTLESGTLSPLIKLHTLYLQNNRLVSLNDTDQLHGLRRLNLSRNRLQHVQLFTMPFLEYLDLSNNQLRHLPPRWLTQTDTLHLLNLAHNKIKHISFHTFNKVTLQQLDLSYNDITVLHNFGMLKLTTLRMSHNKMSAIAEHTFDQLALTLEELDFSHNQFRSLPNHSYSDFIALQRVNLAHNGLGGWLSTGPTSSLFGSLRHVQVLDLSSNNITHLPISLCSHLSHLTTLYVRDNLICDLNHVALSNMPSLAKLDLSSNKLPYVDTTCLRGLHYLEMIDLTANPFQCDCDLIPLLHWINVTHVNVARIEQRSSYMCVGPSELRGHSLMEFHPQTEDCLAHSHDIGQDLTLFGIIVAAVVGSTLLLTAIVYYGKVCQRLKSLHYRWQVRYREVSDIEIAEPKV